MRSRLAPKQLWMVPLACVLLVHAALPAGAQSDPRMFDQTGYRIDNDAFWDYFRSRGAVTTFGYPVSRAFPFLGCTTQFFQRLVMQRCGDGGVGTLNLLDEGLLPYTSFNGSVVPAPDSDLKIATPRPDSPDYGSAILQFVGDNAVDVVDGQPVDFRQTFFSTISPDVAGTNDPNILGLLDLEIWGAPTSRPAHDPGNAGFIYQRFQRGIMHYDQSCNCTRGLLLADYLKAVITGQNLPGDLADQARSSPLLFSAVNGQPPAGTDYSNAFLGVTVQAPTPTPQPQVTDTPTPDTTLGRSKESAPGQVAGTLAFTEPIGSEACSQPVVSSSQSLAIEVKPSTDMPYPAIFVACLTSAGSSTDVKISSVPSVDTATLKTNSASGAHWPPNGPAPPGSYTLTASQPGATSVTTPVSVPEATKQRVLVFPRRGAPGTTFDVYLGGFPPNKPAVLRLYRCDAASCQGSNIPRDYVTSLSAISIDSAGHAKIQVRSASTDPLTEFALLSDDMATRLRSTGGFIDPNDIGKAWFCTAPAPTCRTERD